MVRHLCVLAVMVFLALVAAPDCGALPNPIGVIKSTAGRVEVVRNGSTIKGAPNTLLFEGDLVQTGSEGKVGMILDDDTSIAMGHDSKLVLERFMFQPKERNLSFLARFLKGTLSFISGRIAKLAPHSVLIQTPNAAIGVRGTHILVSVE